MSVAIAERPVESGGNGIKPPVNVKVASGFGKEDEYNRTSKRNNR